MKNNVSKIIKRFFLIDNFKNNPIKIIFYLILPIFIINILFCFNNSKNKIIPDPVELSTLALSIALTELETKNNNYLGNQKVFLEFKSQQSYIDFEKCQSNQILCVMPTLNFDKALKLAKEKEFKKIYYEREDIGLIDYYKISMILFGKNIYSFTILYLTILGISVLIFITNFKENNLYLFLITSFLITNIFVLHILPTLGNELLVVYNRRMLSILSLVPSLHIALTIFDKKKLSLSAFFFLGIQIFLVVLVIHFRSSALYQLIFIFICCFYKYFKERLSYKFYFSYQVPITSVLSLFILFLILLKSNIYFNLDSSYAPKRTGHLFWHPIHAGLSSHPNAKEKYNIYQGDASSFEYVSKISEKKFKNNDWTSFYNYNDFDKILKMRVIKIFTNDPLFFVEAYIHKVIDYFNLIYFEIILKHYYLIFILTTSIIFIANWIVKYNSQQHLKQITFVMLFLSFCSFIPSLMIYPLISYVIDTIILLFLTTIFVIIYFIHTFKNSNYIRNKK